MLRYTSFGRWMTGLLRYSAVGVANTIIGLSIILLLLNYAGCSYWTATAVGTLAGVIVSYSLNRRYTFRLRSYMGGTLPRFIAVALLSYAIAYSCSKPAGLLLTGLLIDIGGANRVSAEQLARSASALLGNGIYTVLGYAGHRYWTFRPHFQQGGPAIPHDHPDPI